MAPADTLVESLLAEHGYFVAERNGKYPCFNIVGTDTITVCELTREQFRLLRTNHRLGAITKLQGPFGMIPLNNVYIII